jgi:hypothetical protein
MKYNDRISMQVNGPQIKLLSLCCSIDAGIITCRSIGLPSFEASENAIAAQLALSHYLIITLSNWLPATVYSFVTLYIFYRIFVKVHTADHGKTYPLTRYQR